MAHPSSTAPSDSELAAKLLREAGALALSIRSGGPDALIAGRRVKSNVSDFATAADLAAEAHVVAALRAARPEDSILGEEGAGHTGTSGRCWVMDPVDGTFNFASGSAYWCTALALVAVPPSPSTDEGSTPDPLTHAEVLVGAVFQPQEDKLWMGGTTVAATLNGSPLHHGNFDTGDAPGDEPRVGTGPGTGPGHGDGPGSGSGPALAELSAGTYIHPGWLAQPRAAVPWQRAAELPATLRMLGSGSCDLARVAQGELGVWFQHSVPSWDWLPGKGIVEAAGGDTAVVRVNGLDWFVAGPAGAVEELCAALESGALPH